MKEHEFINALTEMKNVILDILRDEVKREIEIGVKMEVMKLYTSQAGSEIRDILQREVKKQVHVRVDLRHPIV